MSPLFLVLVLLFFLAHPPLALSSPLSTVAISRAADHTVVCALVLKNTATTGDDEYALNCTTFPYNFTETYSSGSAYYTAVAAGDGFLCGLSTWFNANLAVMLWWEFPTDSVSNATVKRLYRGPAVDHLDAGNAHVCGLLAGRITCWRWRGFSSPAADGDFFDNLAVGDNFVCGLLKSSGEIRCYGTDQMVLNAAPGGNYTAIAAGGCHACALTKDRGRLRCWGSGAPEIRGSEAEMEFKTVALGTNRTCAVAEVDGKVRCWGEDGFRLPEGLNGTEFLSVEAKGGVFCGVLVRNYSLVCWGSEDFNRSSLVVFPRVLPGSCSENCHCGEFAGSGILCPQGTSICNACGPQSDDPDPPGAAPPSPPPESGGGGADDGGGGRRRGRRVAFLVVGAVGAAFGLAAVVGLLFLRYGGGRRWRSQVHDSRRLDGTPPPAAGTSVLRRSSLRPERQEDRSASGSRPWSEVIIAKGPMVEEFPLRALHSATNGFSDENKVGNGSFGSVYRGVLNDGREVAIKRAEGDGNLPPSAHACRTNLQSFLSEVGILSRVNHRNLVRLLGFCREGMELVLVYEFMANGTLHDHLHKLPFSPLMSSWQVRLQVALDTARGVEYLHRYAVPPIIHRDIKPSNILLDGGWTAKVADFGLCLVGPSEDRDNEAGGDGGEKRAQPVPTAGTVGYMDPEYYRLKNLTDKSDVYSFGVLLLELLTGRKAIHQIDDDDEGEGGCEGPCNVVDYAVPRILADEVQEVLDRKLPPPRLCEIEAVQQVGYLAADCVSTEGRHRPDMAEVVDELERAVATCSAGPVVLPPPQPLARSMTAHSV